MKGTGILVLVLAVAMALVLAGCSQSTPSPTAAPAAAAPAKASAAATTAPAVPTAAPAAEKVNFPQKGKAITILVPFSAGGGADIAGRLLAAGLEKELGTPVQVVNKPGASTQTAMTDLVKASPDGYTLGEIAFNSIFVTYLDPARNAGYTKKNFQPIGNFVSIDNVMFVKAGGKYKNIKDVLDDAKQRPEGVKVGMTGILGNTHLVALQLSRLAGVKFAFVNYNGAGEVVTAVLGDHIDVGSGSAGDTIAQYKAKGIIPLATSGREQSPFFPDVKTFTAQGYNLVNTYSIGLSAPAGTPKGVVDVLTNAMKNVCQSPDMKAKFAETAMQVDYMDPAAYQKFWDETETNIKPVIEQGLAENK